MGKQLDLLRTKYIPLIEQEIRAFFREKTSTQIDEVVAKYYEELSSYILRGGKRLRPLALISSYYGFNSRQEGNIIKASISVELLHNSSLIHDDIMDESPKRRGGPSFHYQMEDWSRLSPETPPPRNAGISIGILGGDSLIELGLEALLESDFPESSLIKAAFEYLMAYRKLIEGQLLDLYLSTVTMPTEEEVLRMLSLKTGTLFSASLAIGGILAGAPKAAINFLKNFGQRVGVAFQLQDDILGLYGDEGVIGKPSDSDVKEGKRTLLIVKTWQLAGKEDKKKLLSILGNKNIGIDELNYVRNIVKKLGVLDYTKETALNLLRENEKGIETNKNLFERDFVEFLRELNEIVVARSF